MASGRMRSRIACNSETFASPTSSCTVQTSETQFILFRHSYKRGRHPHVHIHQAISPVLLLQVGENCSRIVAVHVAINDEGLTSLLIFERINQSMDELGRERGLP